MDGRAPHVRGVVLSSGAGRCQRCRSRAPAFIAFGTGERRPAVQSASGPFLQEDRNNTRVDRSGALSHPWVRWGRGGPADGGSTSRARSLRPTAGLLSGRWTSPATAVLDPRLALHVPP